MLPGFFDQSHFLQAVGWGILHSFWQCALLYILFKAIAAFNPNAPSSSRYHLSLVCLFGSLLWFLLTAANQYTALENGRDLPINLFVLNYRLSPTLNQYVMPLASFIYFVLLAVYVLRFCRQYYALYSICKGQLVKAPVDMRLFTQQAAFRIGIKKDVACWLSHQVDAPFVTGFFKPVILLPFSFLNHLTTAQAEAVIMHELAHVKRNDYLINLFQLLAEKLLFFNPFARLLSEAARSEREHCCDDAVLQFRFNQHEYAQALLQVEQLRNQQLLLAMNATNGKKKLLQRIKRIVSSEPAMLSTGWQKFNLATAVFGIAAAILLMVPVSKTITVFTDPVPFAAVFTATENLKSLPDPGPATFVVTEPIANKVQDVEEIVIKENPVNPTQEQPVEEAGGEEPQPSSILINEQLLAPPAEAALTAMPVNNQPAIEQKFVMVKVEEEVGGSREKKVYYIQLNNSNGQTAITPLAVVKQPLTDSLKALEITGNKLPSMSKKPATKNSRPI